MGSLIFILFVLIGLVILGRIRGYKGSDYSNSSGKSFLGTMLNKGRYGEYLTFAYLETLSGYNRLMSNLYLPKKDGTTTEVDLIMISQTGIYVFESKNYSGWIFGNEKNRNWTQSLQNGQKNRFYNPIWQNNGHISALKFATRLFNPNLYKSYIVFSDRCSLKRITYTSPNVRVLNRGTLVRIISRDITNSPELFTEEKVDQIYMKLQKFTLADATTKRDHIENIKSRIS